MVGFIIFFVRLYYKRRIHNVVSNWLLYYLGYCIIFTVLSIQSLIIYSSEVPLNFLSPPTNFRTADETQTLRKHCHARLRRFCIQILFCVDSGILSDSRNDLHVECDLLSCVCKGKQRFFSRVKRRHDINNNTTQPHRRIPT